MKMAQTTRRPCRMQPGDLRRVPQDARYALVGYYVGCPRCGWVTAAIEGDDDLRVTERGDVVTFSAPVTCTGCRMSIHLRESEAELEETADVRRIAPR